MDEEKIYVIAEKQDLREIYDVVQHTIKEIYPKYYPDEVVRFFCALHNEEAIAKDIENGHVRKLLVDGRVVATGCFIEDHITRVYVLPEYQKNGYGTFMIRSIENMIAKNYKKAYLDASLPAVVLYEKLGFFTVKHEKYLLENDVILVYEIMEKDLCEIAADTFGSR